jgi:hypothetical protein
LLILITFAGLQVCRFAGLQVCRFAGLQVCRFAGLQVCRFAGLQVEVGKVGKVVIKATTELFVLNGFIEHPSKIFENYIVFFFRIPIFTLNLPNFYFIIVF